MHLLPLIGTSTHSSGARPLSTPLEWVGVAISPIFMIKLIYLGTDADASDQK